jgi:DNA-binding NarL/FixJ family response regulator
MLNRLSSGSEFVAIRVLIVSSDSLARTSLEASLSGFEGVRVVGLANLNEELAAAIDTFQPDVLLIDADENADSSSLYELLIDLGVPLLLLSDQRPDLDSPGDGWLTRGSRPEQIRAALQAIAHGLIVLDKDQYEFFLTPSFGTDENPVDPLTPRELEVLQLVAEGLTNRAIAFRLGISEFTVKFHINAILTKLDAQSRTEASIKAARLGLILL